MAAGGVAQTPLRLSFAYSPAVLAGLFVAHFLPVLAALPVEVPRWVLLVVLAGCLSSALRLWNRWKQKRGVEIILGADGTACLHQGSQLTPVQVLPASIDWNWLVVMHWKPDGGGLQGCWVWTKDGLDAATWRRLRIWLRHAVDRTAPS